MWQFVATIAVARGFRYVVVGALAGRYGDEAIAFIEANGRVVALVIAGLLVVGLLSYVLWRRRRREPSTAEL